MHTHLSHWLKTGFDFLSIGYIIKATMVGILSHAIQRGWRRKHPLSERKKAIKQHYHLRALKQGHAPESVITCEEGLCVLI